MTEFAIGLALLIALFATRRSWNSYFKQMNDKAQLWVMEEEIELQDKIVDVKQKTQAKIDANKGWHTLKSIDVLKSIKPE